MSLVSRQFFALNTTIEGGLLADDRSGNDLFDKIELRIRNFEKRFSRFLADSELTRLNDRAGQTVPVSRETFELLSAARLIWEKTNGLIDPLIGQALIDAGYDNSFERLDESRPTRPAPDTKPSASFDRMKIDEPGSSVEIPKDGRLDFGGIGKGYLLDTLVSEIEVVTKDYWLALGGDLIVSGTDENGRPWQTGVQNLKNIDQNIGMIDPPIGRWGIATSSTIKRRGTVGSRRWHHIVDPRTGRPAISDVIGATVLTTSAMLADAFAKAVLILGTDQGIAWTEQQPDSEALVITTDQAIHLTSGMEKIFTKI
jgi:thiamine biosynthesis lipoprotein